MKLNLFDRAIAAVAPQRALERLKARGQIALVERFGVEYGARYDTADPGSSSTGWLRNWAHGTRDAAGDTLRALPTLRGQSRDLARNHPLAASAINTKVVRAIGTGLALSAQPNVTILGWTADQALEWRAGVHARFSLWADSTECDWWGDSTFYELQDLVARAMLESGDTWTMLPDGEPTATMPYRLRLQVLEADRVGNPRGLMDGGDIAGGIRRGPNGRVSGVHVYDRHPGAIGHAASSNPWAGKWIEPVGPSGRRRILHHFKMLRPEQPRGVPDLAPVIKLFKDLDTYTDAEIKAAVANAFHAFFIESEGGIGGPPVHGTESTASGHRAEWELGPASVYTLLKGEKVSMPSPGRPNPQFAGFVDAVCHQLGAGLFIGSEMLLKRYNTSYVAARAAFLDAWQTLRDIRNRIARSFCQSIYETWLAEDVSAGRTRASGFFRDPLLRWAYTRANWRGDSQGSINPKDEIAAYVMGVDNRLMSREQAELELWGTDFNETYATKKAEHDRLQRDGMAPVPKAGAPAPPPRNSSTDPEQESTL